MLEDQNMQDIIRTTFSG